MPNIIDSIQISSSTFDVRDKSATTVVNLTQEQYDNLPSSAKTANVLYNITDATAGDLSQYWTSAQTQSAITEATSGKADTIYVDQSVSGKVDITTFNTYSGSVETALSGKQDTLVSGTNIKTINNTSILGSGNIDIQGGGGKAVSAGTNISITTGETADTINCTLNISNGTGTKSIKIGDGVTASGTLSFAQGDDANASGNWSTAFGRGKSTQNYAFSANSGQAKKGYSSAFGASIANNTYGFATGAGSNANGHSSFVSGWYTNSNNNYEAAFGNYNNSVSASTTFGDSGNTLFSVGNGTANNARHNAFEIRQNGDIYLSLNGQDVKLQDQLGGGGGITSGEVQTMIDESISGKTDESAFTAHTADTTIHVSSSEKNTWNNKSDFSGSYNDLTDKPTIPTSVSQLTNDSGYITNGDAQSQIDSSISGKADTSAVTQDIAAAVSGKLDTSTFEVYSGNVETALSGKQDTLSAGTNITIVDNVISAEGGGGKAVTGGTNISVTTGETADTINCTLNISNGTGGMSIKSLGATSASANHAAAFGQNTKATKVCAFAEGWGTTASGAKSHSEGDQTNATGGQSHAEGSLTYAIADHSHSEGYASSATSRVTTMVGITTPYGWNVRHSEGYSTIADNGCTHTEGLSTKALNVAEHSSGAYNVSYTASTTWGDSGNTLFSVGNGTADNARHNAFEIRQNGDIYLTKDGQDVKLQDQLGGGGSSYSAGTGIDITNDVISVTGMTDSSAFTAHTANTTVHTTAAEKTSWNGAATNASNAVTALGGLSLVKLTQAEYDALATKDSNTLYVING